MEDNDSFLDLATFKENFKLIDCWMLLKRNEEQPTQSKKEMAQLLTSLKSSIIKLQNDIQILLELETRESDVIKRSKIFVKMTEIRRLKKSMASALEYSKYFASFDTEIFEQLLVEIENDDDEDEESFEYERQDEDEEYC